MPDLALIAPHVVRADGQGRAMLELARAAAEAGHRVTVYARAVDSDVLDAVRWVQVPGASGGQVVFDLAFARGVSKAMRGAAHDLACVMGGCAMPGIPFVYYAQFCWRAWRATWPMIGAPSPYHRGHALMSARRERRVLSRAVAAIAASHRVAAELRALQESARLPTIPVHAVPNGADLAELPPVTTASRAAARARFGLSADEFVVAFVGEFNTPRKGLAPLVRAIALGLDPRERLVVAGNGRPDRLGVDIPADRVRLLGQVVPVAPLMHAADVVALPSMYEALSLVTLEAAASGIPLLISDRTGASEYLDDACAVVPAPCAPGALRAALDTIKTDPVATARRAARARAVVEEMDWTATAAQGVRVLEDAAGRVAVGKSR